MCSTPPKKYKLSSDILGNTNGQYSQFLSSKLTNYPFTNAQSSSSTSNPSLNGVTSASSTSPPTSPSSHSWRVRRSSFLSEKMMHEDHNSYEVGIAEDGSTRYNLSVKESQGFQWNPDLFVSKFHQQDYYHYSSSNNHGTTSGSAAVAGSSTTGEQFNDHSRPSVQDIVIDSDEDIFPSDY